MFTSQAGDTFQLRKSKGTGERPVSTRYSLLLLNPTEEELGGESDVKVYSCCTISLISKNWGCMR